MKLVLRAVLAAATLASLGCQAYTLPGAIGEQCDLNSDCDAPLICRFGYCRIECDSARDCAAGFDCIFDNEQRGGCQLEIDLGCSVNSDCADVLVCTMGECTNRCGCDATEVPCPDCAPGAACVTADDGTPACLDPSVDSCVYDSDCPPLPGEMPEPFQICAPDLRCRSACTSRSDCRNGEQCVTVDFVREDGEAISGPLCIFMAMDDTMSPSP